MSEKSIIVVMAICVLVLGGYAIYKVKGPQRDLQTEALEAIENRAPTEAPKEAQFESFNASASLAVPASELEINDCRANPVGLKLAAGDPLTISNTGLTPVEIRFNSKLIYAVPAGETVTVNDFLPRAGTIMYYLCNGSREPVGYVSSVK